MWGSLITKSVLTLGLSTPLTQIQDVELIQYLYEKAVRLSGIQSMEVAQLPPIYMVSKDYLNSEVCPEDPENCRSLAAVFDDIQYRILVLEDFEISQNFKPYDYSFVIHELIHALQYRARGAEIFRDCEAVYQTEKQAYDAQDQYLKEEGDFHRVGNILRFFFYCDEEIARAEYLKSKAVWEERMSSGRW